MLAATRALVRMPDLVGMQFSKAKLILENCGLLVEHVVFQESYEPRNTVLAQLPQRGQMVYVGDRVAVGISRDSYVRWLPAIYQRSDLSGRNFVKELLWITQHLFGSIEDVLNLGHTYYDPYEAPEHFLPWLASWTAMVLEEDWPIAKKRRLIKRAVELYRIRGTLRGLKLFISLFTGHEPDIRENEWPFRGWRVGISSSIGIDSVILPPVNLAHTFVVEMPTAYRDLSPESVIRIHEIVRMEKPAHTQYYLRFAAEAQDAELRQFFVIGTRSGIGIGQEIVRKAEALGEPLDPAASTRTTLDMKAVHTGSMPAVTSPPEFPTHARRALPKAPRADVAPVEGREVRSAEEGFGRAARQLMAVEDSKVGKAPTAPTRAVPAPPEPAGPADPADEAITRMMDAADTAENYVGPEGTTLPPEGTSGEAPGEDGPDPPTRVQRPGKKPPPKKR